MESELFLEWTDYIICSIRNILTLFSLPVRDHFPVAAHLFDVVKIGLWLETPSFERSVFGYIADRIVWMISVKSDGIMSILCRYEGIHFAYFTSHINTCWCHLHSAGALSLCRRELYWRARSLSEWTIQQMLFSNCSPSVYSRVRDTWG